MSDGRESKDGLNKDEWLKDDWLKYLESVHPADIEMGLGRVMQVAKTLDLFKPAPIVIVVGGTNGKGTTTALVGQLLAEKGLTSGCYNSPHIHQYNERINRRDSAESSRLSSDEELCVAFSVIEHGRGEIPLTYFEFGTLAALWQIKQWQVDVAILEVGLGGRLDAINIVDTDLAIVTSVGLDHQDWLGDTLDEIGFEKAGIGRKNKPLICGQQKVSQGFLNHAAEIGADLIQIDDDYQIIEKEYLDGSAGWQLKSDGLELLLPKGHIPYFNIASSIMGLKSLGLLPEQGKISKAIENTRVAGRLTQYSCRYQDKQLYFMLDVAHNPQAAAFVASQTKGCEYCVLALLQDKDPVGVVQQLPQITHWQLAGLSGYRGQSSAELAEKLAPIAVAGSLNAHQNVHSAMQFCLDSLADQETALVIGSFFTVSEAEAFISSHKELEVIDNGQ